MENWKLEIEARFQEWLNRLDEENVIRRIFVSREKMDGFTIDLRALQTQVAQLAGTL